MALYESIALASGKAPAGFIGLVCPHAKHGFSTSPSETLDNSNMMLKMAIKGSPLSINRRFH
jgi:phage gp16-like protein